MNTNMWKHPATQANLETLRRRGHVIVEPEEGLLACGMTGPGRLAEPESIADAVVAGLSFGHARDLEGETVLITAGPTQEPLDPVRYHLQPLQRQDGLRAGRSRGGARRAGDPGLGPGATGRAARRAK